MLGDCSGSYDRRQCRQSTISFNSITRNQIRHVEINRHGERRVAIRHQSNGTGRRKDSGGLRVRRDVLIDTSHSVTRVMSSADPITASWQMSAGSDAPWCLPDGDAWHQRPPDDAVAAIAHYSLQALESVNASNCWWTSRNRNLILLIPEIHAILTFLN